MPEVGGTQGVAVPFNCYDPDETLPDDDGIYASFDTDENGNANDNTRVYFEDSNSGKATLVKFEDGDWSVNVLNDRDFFLGNVINVNHLPSTPTPTHYVKLQLEPGTDTVIGLASGYTATVTYRFWTITIGL